MPRVRGREWQAQQRTPPLPQRLPPPPLSRSGASQGSSLGCRSACRSRRHADLEAISISTSTSTSTSIARGGRSGRAALRICHVRRVTAPPAGRRPFGQGCADPACPGRAPRSASATHGGAAGCGRSGRALASVGGCGCAFGGCGCAVAGCGSAARGCGIALRPPSPSSRPSCCPCSCSCSCPGSGSGSLRQRVPWQATRQAPPPDQQPQPRSRCRPAPARSARRTVATRAWMPALVWARAWARAQARVLRPLPVSAAPGCARPRRPRCCSEAREHRRRPPSRRLSRVREAAEAAARRRAALGERLARLRRARLRTRSPCRRAALVLPRHPPEQPRDSALPPLRQAAEAGARCASRS